MEYIQPYLDYFTHHPQWAIAIIFLIAFGEALLIIGLFVPSTAVLVGAGMLVGTGHLGFWPVFIATAVGAIIGDQLSFWAGRLFGLRLKSLWPLSRYPALVARGEEFVRKHGGKSIAIGRFVPGVKAVVPGIVGMFGMSQAYFASINVASGLVWTACHVFPGMLLGQGLAMAGEISGRLVIVLLVLLALLAVAGWVIRLAIGGLVPVVERGQRRLSAWAERRPEAWLRDFGALISPAHPGSAPLIGYAVAAALALILFLSLTGRLRGGTILEADVSMHNMMQSLRNAPGDEIMIVITMLGDWATMIALALAMVLWLAWRRAWGMAAAVTLVVVSSWAFVAMMKPWLERTPPGDVGGMLETFSFPSAHTTFVTVTLGVLALLASQGLKLWGRALVFAMAGIAIIAIAYSSIYLGTHWVSDVAGGLLFGAVLLAAFGAAIATAPPARIMPLGLTAAALAALLVAGTVNITHNYEARAALYEPHEATVLYDVEQWLAGGWASVGTRRVDLVGKADEPFVAQWVGSLDPIVEALRQAGWTSRPPWTWASHIVPYLDPSSALPDLEPRPALHRGRRAIITWTMPVKNDAAQRLVLRAWRTDFAIAEEGNNREVYVISVTRERLRKGLNLYAVPSPLRPTPEDEDLILSLLRSLKGAAVLEGAGLGPRDLPVLLATTPG